EPPRLYAHGPVPATNSSPGENALTYVKADPAAVYAPQRDRFYDASYRGDLRKMVDHVVEIEGPIYFDVPVDRIARAHGFQRSGEVVQKVVGAALGPSRFTTTRDGDREIVWPSKTKISKKMAYRGAGGRDHGDIPLPELAGLAAVLQTEGLDDEEIVRRMQEH